jgi:hypothetical protein
MLWVGISLEGVYWLRQWNEYLNTMRELIRMTMESDGCCWEQNMLEKDKQRPR